MPAYELVWSDDAVTEVAELIGRREARNAVRDCIEGHLLAVADNPAIAIVDLGPREFLIYRFTCRDGDVGLNLQAEFEILDAHRIGVVGCNSIQL
jgi:hypothetical protein